jgi:glutamate synthase (NADPH/NADH) large chain
MMAEEARGIMAELGIRTFDELIGRVDLIDTRRAISHFKAKGLDFSKLLYKPRVAKDVLTSNKAKQDHGLEGALDHVLIAKAEVAIASGTPIVINSRIRNINRTVGAMLSGRIAEKYGHAGLPEDTISVKFKGIAGQSFGAFLARGVSLELSGSGNDYVGKGLSGGRISVFPPPECPAEPSDNIVVGNTVLYGAIDGECYFAGVAGERFAVRNSGAVAVVEGVGDHGCEYMTGGTIVVIGQTGRNFAAGMSGGIAYVLDEDGDFAKRCNMAMVDLERITPEPVVVSDSGSWRGLLSNHLSQDTARLHMLIARHLRYTGSARAKLILDNWDRYLPKFVKVMPSDYSKSLKTLEASRVQDDVSFKIAAVSHG